MQGFFGLLFYIIGIILFMLPVALALYLINVVAGLFSGVCKPVTEPIHAAWEKVSGRIPDPLDKIPSIPKIKRYFGSAKNILFICFASVFLVFHYLSLGIEGVALTNLSLLFPGSAFEVLISFFISYGTSGKVDTSYLIIGPESYLQTVIFTGITGLFLHIGCTTKEEDTRIHFSVKLLYILIITLFSSAVLGRLPSDMFTVALPEYSAQLEPVSLVIDTTNTQMMLATLWQWEKLLLEKMVTLLPLVVAAYFLCQSVSGFAAAFLGGIFALAVLSQAFPQVLSQAFIGPYSVGSSVILVFAVTLAEAVALLVGEYIHKIAGRLLEKIDKVFDYYNIVSLLISYLFYPLLVIPVWAFLHIFFGTIYFTKWLVCAVCLAVFAAATFAGYKINGLALGREKTANMKQYALLMVINIPILLVYVAMFNL